MVRDWSPKGTKLGAYFQVYLPDLLGGGSLVVLIRVDGPWQESTAGNTQEMPIPPLITLQAVCPKSLTFRTLSPLRVLSRRGARGVCGGFPGSNVSNADLGYVVDAH